MTFSPTSEPTTTIDERTFCAVHPNVETSLRCNKCGRYMCSKCSVQTPVGYRCKQCVYQQQEVFYTANQFDTVIALAVSAVLSAIIAPILTEFGLFGVLVLGLPAGALISEAVFRLTGRRRGRYTWAYAAAGIVIGGLISYFVFNPALLAALTTPNAGRQLGGVSFGGLLTAMIYPLLYVVLAAGAAIARLR